jgi:aspartate-semialdehyde dehydrogenase
MRTAILGATGLVGRVMLELLEARDWVDEPPLLLVSERSEGKPLPFRGEELACVHSAETSIEGVNLALFSAGAAASLEQAARFVDAGAWVVDNSTAFRMDDSVPLMIPEINAATLPDRPQVIANPNCSTMQIAMTLAPLHTLFGLKACHVTTLQSVSGAGGVARSALEEQLRLCMPRLHGDLGPGRQEDVTGGVFPHQIAFNAIPEIGAPEDDGSFAEEAKVVNEMRKIFDLPDLAVTCLATRVPVWNSHSASIRAVFDRPVDRDRALGALHAFPGLQVADSPHGYRTALDASGKDDCFVGRVRLETGRDDVLLLWVVADNLRKGAALNAVQIADRLATDRLS